MLLRASPSACLAITCIYPIFTKYLQLYAEQTASTSPSHVAKTCIIIHIISRMRAGPNFFPQFHCSTNCMAHQSDVVGAHVTQRATRPLADRKRIQTYVKNLKTQIIFTMMVWTRRGKTESTWSCLCCQQASRADKRDYASE